MKRIVLALLTIFVLTAAGALVAQSPQNTTAPGPTQQRAPGMTNNNLPNPGNPQTDLSRQTTTGTTSTAPSGEGIRPETERGTGMDVDVDTGSRANGAVDVDVSRTTDADTDASGINETGENNNAGQSRLPNTASDLPMTALIGLICLGAAFSIRTLAKRDV